MSLAENLKLMRKFRHYTQEQLAERAGISCSAVINYENGRRKDVRGSVIAKLAQALDFPESFFSEEAEVFSDGIVIGLRNRDIERKLSERTCPIEVKESENKNRIHEYLAMLNAAGQQEAVRQVSLLTRIPEYQKEQKQDNT